MTKQIPFIRKDQDSITRVVLHWTPEGKRKGGRPRNTWRRTVEAEMMKWKKAWGTVEKMAKDRKEWRSSNNHLFKKYI